LKKFELFRIDESISSTNTALTPLLPEDESYLNASMKIEEQTRGFIVAQRARAPEEEGIHGCGIMQRGTGCFYGSEETSVKQ